MLVSMSDLMTIEEVAERINRTPRTVRYWIANKAELGPLSAKIGRRRMFRRADVERWLDEQFKGE